MCEQEQAVLTSIGAAVAAADDEEQRVFAAIAAAYCAGVAAGKSKEAS